MIKLGNSSFLQRGDRVVYRHDAEKHAQDQDSRLLAEKNGCEADVLDVFISEVKGVLVYVRIDDVVSGVWVYGCELVAAAQDVKIGEQRALF